MTLLAFSSVTVQFGAAPLLTDVSFTVAPGERWGIVGRNGTGKTTLLRLMTGAMEAEAGFITRRPGLRLTLLDQHREFGKAKTVWEAAAGGYEELLELEISVARESERLGELGDQVTDADLKQFDRIQERFHHDGGYAFLARVDAVLQGLGFDAEAARDRPLHELSGGERGRVGWAAQLAAPADMILLDEPTNHLDVESIEALEDALERYPGTVLLVSHDRALLRELATRVWAFREGRLHDYPGPFVDWEQRVAQEEGARAAERLGAEQATRAEGKAQARRAAEAKRLREGLESGGG